MDQQQVISIAVQTMIVTAKVCTPILAISLCIGLTVSILQSVTQIQEITLTFVPKLVGVGVVIILMGNWMLSQLVAFTRDLYLMIPKLLS